MMKRINQQHISLKARFQQGPNFVFPPTVKYVIKAKTTSYLNIFHTKYKVSRI